MDYESTTIVIVHSNMVHDRAAAMDDATLEDVGKIVKAMEQLSLDLKDANFFLPVELMSLHPSPSRSPSPSPSSVALVCSPWQIKFLEMNELVEETNATLQEITQETFWTT